MINEAQIFPLFALYDYSSKLQIMSLYLQIL